VQARPAAENPPTAMAERLRQRLRPGARERQLRFDGVLRRRGEPSFA